MLEMTDLIGSISTRYRALDLWTALRTQPQTFLMGTKHQTEVVCDILVENAKQHQREVFCSLE